MGANGGMVVDSTPDNIFTDGDNKITFEHKAFFKDNLCNVRVFLATGEVKVAPLWSTVLPVVVRVWHVVQFVLCVPRAQPRLHRSGLKSSVVMTVILHHDAFGFCLRLKRRTPVAQVCGFMETPRSSSRTRPCSGEGIFVPDSKTQQWCNPL